MIPPATHSAMLACSRKLGVCLSSRIAIHSTDPGGDRKANASFGGADAIVVHRVADGLRNQ
jgi:hypothetical protein